VVSKEEYRNLLNVFNATKTLLQYKEMDKQTPSKFSKDMIDFCLERVQKYIELQDQYENSNS
jgi:hypothetical protein